MLQEILHLLKCKTVLFYIVGKMAEVRYPKDGPVDTTVHAL